MSVFLVCVTVAVFSAMYTPQPMLATLAGVFGVSGATAQLAITLTLLPLGIAPVAWGFVLARTTPRRLLILALTLLAASEAAILASNVFWFFLAVRFVQGLLIPAALTALMTYVAQVSRPESVPKAMAAYVAATILGGWFGRLASGFLCTLVGWRAPFAVLAVVLGLCALILSRRAQSGAILKAAPLRLSAALTVLRRPGFFRVYAIVFLAFFVFAGFLNTLPLRLSNLGGAMSEFRVGLMYSGYLMGIVVSLSSQRIIAFLGGATNAVRAGLALHLASLPIFLTGNAGVVFGAMFLFCAGMFLTHSVAPGILNARVSEDRGVLNGLYVAFYYTGGALGSSLPGLVYQTAGWAPFLTVLAAALALALVLTLGLCRRLDSTTCEEGRSAAR